MKEPELRVPFSISPTVQGLLDFRDRGTLGSVAHTKQRETRRIEELKQSSRLALLRIMLRS